MKPMKYCLFVFTVLCSLATHAQNISTFAGTGAPGFSGDGGPAAAAQFRRPYCIHSDTLGNLFIGDALFRIRRVDVSSGVVSTYAGTGSPVASGDGGPALAAGLTSTIFSIDSKGNIYLIDYVNFKIRKISSSGIITNYAGTGVRGYSGDGGPATSANISAGQIITSDQYGNVYISFPDSNCIRKIDTAGIITTVVKSAPGFSGDGGPAATAQINNPNVVHADRSGNLYFWDYGNYRIRKISATGIITTIAGNGVPTSLGDGVPATTASLDYVGYIFKDKIGNIFFPQQRGSHVRCIDTFGMIYRYAGDSTDCGFAGDGGHRLAAQFCYPYGITADKHGRMYIADTWNHRVRKIDNYLGVDGAAVAVEEIVISPNPAAGMVGITGLPRGCHISVTNMAGRQVYEARPVAQQHTMALHVPPGMYLCTISSSAGTSHHKIMISGE